MYLGHNRMVKNKILSDLSDNDRSGYGVDSCYAIWKQPYGHSEEKLANLLRNQTIQE